jgi:hypothetical protein
VKKNLLDIKDGQSFLFPFKKPEWPNNHLIERNQEAGLIPQGK